MTNNDVTMEIYHPLLHDFLGSLDRYEPVGLDHTAIITYKECPRKYFYQIVLGRVPNETQIYFAWGSAYHKFRQKMEEAYGLGKQVYSENKAMIAFGEGLKAGIAYWKKHGRDQQVTDKFSWMTEARLIQSFKAAYLHWVQEKQRGLVIVLAVEQPFNVQLPDGSRRGGTADQIITWNGKVLGRDFKTTSKECHFYERTLDPNEQFTGYTYCEGLLGNGPLDGQLVEVLYNGKSTKTANKGPEIWELTAFRTKEQLDRWAIEHSFWTESLRRSRELDIYPQVEKTCSFCPYHQVCTQSSEGAMAAELRQNYLLRPWDHTKVGLD